MLDAASLGEPFPNPSAGSVSAVLVLESPCQVRATVYDIRGNWISCILDGPRPAGEQEIIWSGEAPAGVYLLHVEASGESFTRRILKLNK